MAFVRPAKKIYEAPAECWAGFAPAASAPRLIFDFHLIIFFFPATFNSVSGEANKGMRMGDGKAGSGGWGIPPIRLEPPERPRFVLLRAFREATGGRVTGQERRVGDSSQGLGGRCRGSPSPAGFLRKDPQKCPSGARSGGGSFPLNCN